MRRLFGSLFQKAFITVAIAIIPAIAIILITYYSNKNQIKENIQAELNIVMELFEKRVYQFLEMSGHRAADFASDGFTRDSLERILRGKKDEPELLNQYLIKNKMPLDKSLNAIYIVSLTGEILASTDRFSIGRNIAREPFFTEKHGDTQIAEVDSSFAGTSGLAISTTLYGRNSGQPIGALVNHIRLSGLNNIVGGDFSRERAAASDIKKLRRTLNVYMVNKRKQMITDSLFLKGTVLHQTVDIPPVDDCIASGRGANIFYSDYRNVNVVGASACIAHLKWTLLATIDEDEAFAALSKMRNGALIVGTIFAGLFAALFVLFVRNIIRPLKSISSAAGNIADGKYDVGLHIKSNDEIGALSESFNRMVHDINRREIMLRESEERLRAIIDNTNAVIYLKDREGKYILVNRGFEYLFNLSRKDIIGKTDREILPDEVARVFWDNDINVFKTGIPTEVEEVIEEGGRVHYYLSAKVPIFGLHDAQSAVCCIATDITGRKLAEMELKKLSTVLEQSTNMVFITDPRGNIEYVNSMFEHVTGYMKDEVIGKNPRMLGSGETTKAQYEELWGTIRRGNTWRGIFKNRKKNGQHYWSNGVISPIKNEKGEIIHFFAIQEDITEKKKTEEMAQYLTSYDGMTGLINRSRFMELINVWISYDLKASGQTAALILIDVDEFKYINDTYGHGMGDEFLRRVARLLENLVQDADKRHLSSKTSGSLIGRLGGDEFAVFVPFTDRNDVNAMTALIQKNVEGLHSYMSIPVNLTTSIGVAYYPEHGTSTKELFTKADAAMFHAKETGKGKCHVYQTEDHDLEKMHSRLEWRGRIQRALEEVRFEPWFQPILDLRAEKINHYEVLVRMRDEEGNILMPGEFIESAEIFGLIGAIDRLVTEKIMKMQAEVSRHGRRMTFGMNLSGKDIGDIDLLSFLSAKIIESGADPDKLLFEITETAAVSDMARAVKFIKTLKSMGCHFALDDFGVGFTSFVYLRDLQVDYIKIDGSFIKNMRNSKTDQFFVKALVDVAKGLGIKTIAEFVEQIETIDMLREFGVDYAQGYAIGRPGPYLLNENYDYLKARGEIIKVKT